MCVGTVRQHTPTLPHTPDFVAMRIIARPTPKNLTKTVLADSIPIRYSPPMPRFVRLTPEFVDELGPDEIGGFVEGGDATWFLRDVGNAMAGNVDRLPAELSASVEDQHLQSQRWREGFARWLSQ